MEFTHGEKFIIRLIADIGEQLKAVTGNTGEFDYTFIKAAVESGNAWALRDQFHIAGESFDYPPAVEEVREILGMWEVIAQSFENLSAFDKKAVEAKEDPDFHGFDGEGEEEQVRIAQFVMEHIDDFDVLQNRHLETGPAGSLVRYRLMLQIFNEVLGSIEQPSMGPKLLTAQQIVEVLKARRPDDSGLRLVPKPD